MTPIDSTEERRKYVNAFNATMIKIWREQITLLGVVDTGALYRSTVGISTQADGKFTSVTLAQSFNTYGLFVDYGTGSNTPRGQGLCQREQSRTSSGSAECSQGSATANSGDLGKGYTNKRKRKRWFSRKYFASVMNLQEFFADNLGKDMANTISNALTRDLSRRFVS